MFRDRPGLRDEMNEAIDKIKKGGWGVKGIPDKDPVLFGEGKCDEKGLLEWWREEMELKELWSEDQQEE